jgi:hypothetical protein
VGRAPGEPAQRPREAVHRLLLRLPPQPQPRARGLVVRGLPLPGRRAADARPVRGRVRRPRDLPAGRARRVLPPGLRPDRGGVGTDPGQPGQAHVQPQLRPPQRRERAGPAAGRRGAVRAEGRQALHGRVARGVPRLQADRPLGVPVPGGVPGARHHQHPRAQGPDDPAAGPGRVRRRRHRPRRVRLHRPQLRGRARRAAPAGGLLLDRHPGAQRVRRAGRGDAVHAHPPAVLREDHGRADLLDRRGPDLLLQRLRAVDAEVAGRAVRGLPDPGRADRVRTADHRAEEEGARPQRGQAVRHPGAGRAAAAGRGRDRDRAAGDLASV